MFVRNEAEVVVRPRGGFGMGFLTNFSVYFAPSSNFDEGCGKGATCLLNNSPKAQFGG